MKKPKLIPYGEAAILISYPVTGYSEQAVSHVQALSKTLRKSVIWEEVVPAYNSILVMYDPVKHEYSSVISRLERAIDKIPRQPKPKTKDAIEIPVYYGGKSGPDMQLICDSSGLTQDKVIALHSQKPYRVCMLGFIPGFTFLSEAPEKLHHPRRDTPRPSVPAGSIGIGGWQTGIYSLSSPGGWQIIGRTPLKIFDAERKSPFFVKPGDYVRFVPQSGPDPELAEGET